MDLISVSYLLDIVEIKKSWQDKTQTFDSIVKEVVNQYQGGDSIIDVGQGVPLKKFTLQYRETDWNFLKRMASRFNAPLVVDSGYASPKIRFGLTQFEAKAPIKKYEYILMRA